MARTQVAIVGGGPSGLILAIELGRRGVPCVLLEERATPPTLPKANATTSRTMEHYRRLGFAAEIRALGLPEDYPQDVAYFTRYTGHELARLKGRSRREAIEAREGADSRWPTPEPCQDYGPPSTSSWTRSERPWTHAWHSGTVRSSLGSRGNSSLRPMPLWEMHRRRICSGS